MKIILILLQSLGKIEATPPVVIILIFFCLLFFFISAVCSGGEQAFYYLDDQDFKRIKARDDNESRKLNTLLDRPRVLTTTLLISRTISNVLLIFILNALIDFLVSIKVFPTLSITIKIIVIFFLLVLFCETMPRAYARQEKLRMAFFAAPLVSSLVSIFESVAVSLIDMSDWLSVKVFKKSNELLTVTDLEEAFAGTPETGEEKEEKEILRGLIGFEGLTVRQVMKNRMDIVGVSEKSTFSELLEIINREQRSRIPVYSGDMDHIIGVINIRDLIGHVGENEFDWQTVMSRPMFVHEQKLIKNLLQEFQLTHAHLAVVVDEFGGTSGIVTMKNIMEEVVGDIGNEVGRNDINYKRLSDKEFIFEGKIALTEAVRVLDLPLGFFSEVKGDSESLAGLILEMAGSFPDEGEELSQEGLILIPEEVADLRITKVKIILP
ncbi:MAG TPA: CNNM domain-containing protein [Chitinophagaceae bacterium]|nr:CNNM domain-containing protein [Chitinophagaceae bacterium]